MKPVTLAIVSTLLIQSSFSQTSKKTTAMSNQSYTTTILVDQSPEQVFNAITNVRGWWSEEVEGGTSKLNDEFLYHFKHVHVCKIKLTEVVPGKKVEWLVLENYFNFIKDQKEWKGTKMSFEISKKGDKTELLFTHHGLVPEYECYDICKDGWSNYINISLRNLIATGKGSPNAKEGGFNQALLEKFQAH
jgi:uncharacterized protein YndB with AHSA1/START domain